jgi:uncharacterized protein YcfL
MKKILLPLSIIALALVTLTACSAPPKNVSESKEPTKVQSTKAYVYTANEGTTSKVDVILIQWHKLLNKKARFIMCKYRLMVRF